MDATRWITTEPLDLDALLRETQTPAAGAVVVFGGTVRELNDGRPVTGMSYDHHPSLAAKVLRELEAEVLRDFDVLSCRIQHRVGALDLGEVSVYVVVRSAHRGAAFDAGKYAIDTLKARLPVWKLEHYTDGERTWLPGTPLKAL